MPERLRGLIIAIVTFVWAANFTAPLFIKDYKSAPELNVVFMAILSVVTAAPTRSSGDDDQNGSAPP